MPTSSGVEVALGGVDGWYYTPGWGALATVTVALLALVVSTWFNVRTLRRSSEQLSQASRQFRQLRDDNLTDKLRVEIAGLLAAMNERDWRIAVAERQMNAIRDPGDTSTERGIAELDLALKAVVAEHLTPMHLRAFNHLFTMELLTDDPTLAAKARELSQLLDEDREAVHDHAIAQPNSDFEKRWHQDEKLRADKIDALMQRLLAYAIVALNPHNKEDLKRGRRPRTLPSEGDAQPRAGNSSQRSSENG